MLISFFYTGYFLWKQAYIYCSVNTIVWFGTSLTYIINETCKYDFLLPVASFKYSGIFHNVVEMPSHDINTSMQLRLYSKLLSSDLFKPENALFDPWVSSSVRHSIEVCIIVCIIDHCCR